MIAAYIHTGAKVGVLVEVGAGRKARLGTMTSSNWVKDITLQIAAVIPFGSRGSRSLEMSSRKKKRSRSSK